MIVTRFALLIFSMWLVSSVGMSKPKYGMAGCGLGSVVLGASGSQILAATTNGTGMQSSAITSGTSNCMAGGKIAVIQQQEKFVSINLKPLAKDMAKGNGEYLVAYAEFLGCQDSSITVVANHFKSEFREIFKHPGALAILSASKKTLKQNGFQNRCNQLY